MPTSRQRRYDARDQIDRLRALADDPAAQAQFAITLMHDARDLDVARAAIGRLADLEDPAARDDLRAKYEWCNQQPTRRDGGGYIRAAVVRALRPISGPDELPIAIRAMRTYEMDGPFELCGELRTAGLLLANDIDPAVAAIFAARLLSDPQMSYSGEPAGTAIRLLASHGNLAPIFGVVSWQQARPEVLGEGLRSLTAITPEVLPMIVQLYQDTDDEQIMLGLIDLLLGHPTRDQWADTLRRIITDGTMPDLTSVIATQIVASRSETLIDMLRDVARVESDVRRRDDLLRALELA